MNDAIRNPLVVATAACALIVGASLATARPADAYVSFGINVGPPAVAVPVGPGPGAYYGPTYYGPAYGAVAPAYYAPAYGAAYYGGPGYDGRPYYDRHERWEHERWEHERREHRRWERRDRY